MSRVARRYGLIAVFLFGSFGGGATAQSGPGLPNLIYEQSELFTTITTIGSVSHGHSMMHDGYLAVVKTGLGVDFYDLSNPYQPQQVQTISAGCHKVDLDRSEVHFADGEVSPLSEMETSILRYLATNCDRVISRDELLANVWGIRDQNFETRAVDMHITRLRTKLDASGDDSVEWIKTVRGRGYALGKDLVVTRKETAGERPS